MARHSMPVSGAIFLTNPRKRKKSPYKNVIARLNGSKRRRNGSKRRISLKANPVALKVNPLARRRRNGSKRKGGSKRSYLRNPLSGMMKGLRRNMRHRKNGAAVVTPQFLKPFTGAVSKIPLAGPIVAPVIAPALFGAGGLGATWLALQWTGQYIPTQVKPFAYTLGGTAVGLLLQAVPTKILGQQFKQSMALGAVVAGAGVDLFRYLSDTGASFVPSFMLPGSSSSVEKTSEDISVEGIYADASPLDAGYAGADLTQREGMAAYGGGSYWHQAFGRPPVRTSNISGARTSAHAGHEGHRWGWLIKMIGFDRFRAIARLPASQRRAFLAKARQAVAAQAALATENTSLAGIGLDGYHGIGLQGYHGIALDGERVPVRRMVNYSGVLSAS